MLVFTGKLGFSENVEVWAQYPPIRLFTAKFRPVDAYCLHVVCYTIRGDSMQQGKTGWTHYNMAYHLVWIPKYRRKVLTGDVQVETKRLIAECCERNGMTPGSARP